MALNRTGRCRSATSPSRWAASTKGHEATADYETKAYKYFAGLNDPNLVRVVQYAGVFQIFRKFGRGGGRAEEPTLVQRRAIQR